MTPELIRYRLQTCLAFQEVAASAATYLARLLQGFQPLKIFVRARFQPCRTPLHQPRLQALRRVLIRRALIKILVLVLWIAACLRRQALAATKKPAHPRGL